MENEILIETPISADIKAPDVLINQPTQHLSVNNLMDLVSSDENRKFLEKKGVKDIKDFDKLTGMYRNLESQFTKVSQGKMDFENPILAELAKEKLGISAAKEEDIAGSVEDIKSHDFFKTASEESKDLIIKEYDEQLKSFKSQASKLGLSKSQANELVGSIKDSFIRKLDPFLNQMKEVNDKLLAIDVEWGVNKENNMKTITKAILENNSLKSLVTRNNTLTSDPDFLKFIFDSSKSKDSSNNVPFHHKPDDEVSQYTEIGLNLINKLNNNRSTAVKNY